MENVKEAREHLQVALAQAQPTDDDLLVGHMRSAVEHLAPHDLKCKPGDCFTTDLKGVNVLMVAVRIRCGDVWDCQVSGLDKSGLDESVAKSYSMVITDSQLWDRSTLYKFLSKWERSRASKGLL